jgi:hypothetical protein
LRPYNPDADSILSAQLRTAAPEFHCANAVLDPSNNGAEAVHELRHTIEFHTTEVICRLDDLESGQLRFAFMSSPPRRAFDGMLDDLANDTDDDDTHDDAPVAH